MNRTDQCCKMRLDDVRSLLRSDLDRYLYNTKRRYSWRAVLIVVATQPGFLATALYRFGHWSIQEAGMKGRWGKLLHALARRPVEVLTGISILPEAHIGRGLYIAHFGGVIVGPCLIGENCNLGHDTLIGTSGRGERRGAPQLGDRVNVTCGGRVIGPVYIGDDVMIGVNVVVTKDVPARSVLAAAPAVTISQRGSFDYLRYPGDEDDPARTESASLTRDVPLSEELQGAPRLVS